MHSRLRQRLRSARDERQYTQRELAAAAGISRVTLLLLETREAHDPRLSALIRLSDALGDPHLFCAERAS